MRLIAFDPGGTTGWEYAKYSDTEPIEFIVGGQIPNGVAGVADFFRNQFRQLVAYDSEDIYVTGFTVVSESFTLRPGVKMPNLEPVRIEGAFTAFWDEGFVQYQQPSAKALVPDATLKRLGLWIPGQRHQMDARIHALAYMMRQGHLPTLTKYFPEQVGE